MGGMERDTRGESKGLTFADILQREEFLTETLLEGVLILLICHCVILHFSFSINFICRNNMVATHLFHKLVFSVRLYMKMASWGFCILVFDSSGEPAFRPEETMCDLLCSSGSKFVVGHPTSNEEAVSASTAAPMEISSSM